MHNLKKTCGSVFFLAFLSGCGGADELTDRVPSGFAGTPVVFNDSISRSSSALDVRTELRGVNSDGKNAVVRVSWSLTDSGSVAVQPNSQVILREYSDGVPKAAIDVKPISLDDPSGSVDVPVNTDEDADTQWYLELDRANLQAVPDVASYAVVERKQSPRTYFCRFSQWSVEFRF